MGYVILLWHSLSLPYNYSLGGKVQIVRFVIAEAHTISFSFQLPLTANNSFLMEVQLLGKKKKMCVSGYLSKKTRVGRSLLNFYFFLKLYLLLSLILKSRSK